MIFFRAKKKNLAIIVFIIITVWGLKILVNPSPTTIMGLSNFICPKARYFFDTDKPLVAITIDDSPDNNHLLPHTTLAILDVLAQYQAKATFFIIINKAKEYPQLLTAIVQQGHELGNHLTNDESSIKLNNFETEFLQADRFLNQFAAIKWFRPGHGWCNASMTEVAKKYNYQIALGSVWSYDTSITSAKFASWYIKQNIRPGSIIVLHDSSDKSDRRGQNTIKTLNIILPQLQQQGYRFVTLSELEAVSVE